MDPPTTPGPPRTLAFTRSPNSCRFEPTFRISAVTLPGALSVMPSAVTVPTVTSPLAELSSTLPPRLDTCFRVTSSCPATVMVPWPVLVIESPVMVPPAVRRTCSMAVMFRTLIESVFASSTPPFDEVALRLRSRTSRGLPVPMPSAPMIVSWALGNESAMISSRVSPPSRMRPAVLLIVTALADELPLSIPVMTASPTVSMPMVPRSARSLAASLPSSSMVRALARRSIAPTEACTSALVVMVILSAEVRLIVPVLVTFPSRVMPAALVMATAPAVELPLSI